MLSRAISWASFSAIFVVNTLEPYQPPSGLISVIHRAPCLFKPLAHGTRFLSNSRAASPDVPTVPAWFTTPTGRPIALTSTPQRSLSPNHFPGHILMLWLPDISCRLQSYTSVNHSLSSTSHHSFSRFLTLRTTDLEFHQDFPSPCPFVVLLLRIHHKLLPSILCSNYCNF